MRVEAVELRVVRMALVRPFAAAHGTTTSRDVLIVHVVGPDGEGWGECAADVVATYWHETVSTAWADLLTVGPNGLAAGAGPMARAALEMALVDLELRASGAALASHLGATATAVDVTVTAGLTDDVDALLAGGYRSLKVKVAPGPLPRLAYAGVAVQVDANGSFDPDEDAPLLAELDAAGLALIEQPFAADRLEAHAALELSTPVALDESITSIAAASTAIAAGACDAMCVKPSRLGGLRAAVDVHDLCVATGTAAKVGGMLETGIGRAAALALAALPGFTLPADLSASDRYWAEDVVAEPARLDADGRIAVPSGPGLGVDVRADVLAACTVQHAVVRLAR